MSPTSVTRRSVRREIPRDCRFRSLRGPRLIGPGLAFFLGAPGVLSGVSGGRIMISTGLYKENQRDGWINEHHRST